MNDRPEGLDALLNHIDDLVTHNPMLVRWNNHSGRWTMPAVVCDTCSDQQTGTWVLAVLCGTARAKLQSAPDCAYNYGVIMLEGEPG